jgi:uncharacterized repeat protein (TIGR02543 family)
MDENGTVQNTGRQCAVVDVFENPAALDSITGKGNLIQRNDDNPSNCFGIVSTANPTLGPLQYNFGATPTMAIPVESPAVDAGASTVVSELGPIDLDQRRVRRPDGAGFDIGAFEACVPEEQPCEFAEEFSSDELLILTVQVSPAGGGTTAPTAGPHSYDPQSLVPLIATPATGYAFDNWSGDAVTAPTSASTTILMDAHRTVTANFHLLPNFSLSAVTPLTVVVGGSSTGAVTVNANAAFAQTVTLSPSGLPAGFSAVLNPASLALAASTSGNSQLRVTLGPTVLPGTYSFNVLGTAGTLSHTALVSVTVIASPDGVAQVIGTLTGLGCIDSGGISNAFVVKLRLAQSALNAGDVQTAVNILSALLNQLQAQAGKHVISCPDGAGGTIAGAQVLIDQVRALLASLGAGLRPDPVVGSLVQEITGVTITIATGAKTIVASAATDAAGFYYFAKTSAFKVGTEYTVSVTLPKGYKASIPSTQKFIWRAEQTALAPFLLK